ASGLTRGSIYALVGLGFALIYNASHIINFAQGEFVMLGGMLTAFLVTTLGLLPVWLAIPLVIAAMSILGISVYRFAVQPARHAGILQIIIVTIGASVFLRGLVEVTLGKQEFVFPPFFGDTSISVLDASISTQSVSVIVVL